MFKKLIILLMVLMIANCEQIKMDCVSSMTHDSSTTVEDLSNKFREVCVDGYIYLDDTRSYNGGMIIKRDQITGEFIKCKIYKATKKYNCQKEDK